MKKKILSLALVVAMLASMLVLAPTSGAAQGNKITVGRATGVAGDIVSVDVVLTTELPVYTFQFALDYDKTKLQLLPLVAETDGDTVGIKLPSGLPVPNVSSGKAGEMVATSPYQVFGWSRAVGANPLDATSGYVIATLNFKVLADTLGDAYVAVCETPLSYFDTSDDTLNPGSTYDIEYVSGAVTVLPEGYDTPINVPEDAWDFEGGVIYGIKDDSVLNATGALVIPSQIGGVDVVELEAQAVDGSACSTIVVPASIKTLRGGAIANCTNLTKVYVLGETTVLEQYAIGYECSFRRGAITGTPILLLNANSTAALTTIYGAAGSTAETYANTGTDVFPFVAEGVCSVTFGENTYLTGATVQAPGVAVDGDKLTVAWEVGDKTYGAGELMTLEGPVTLKPVIIAKPTVNSTLGFKIGEDEKGVFAAMRFTTDMKTADYEKLATLGDVTMGTLITPARYVSRAGALTREALDQLSEANGGVKTYVDVTTEGYFELENDDTYTFAGSLKHIQEKNVDLTYAAAFYLTVETTSGSFTVYSDFVFANNRDAYSAAQAVAEGGYVGMTEPQIEVLDDFIADCAAIIASRENN